MEAKNQHQQVIWYLKYKACIPKEKLIELFNRYEK